jgi:hypothetical protein
MFFQLMVSIALLLIGIALFMISHYIKHHP